MALSQFTRFALGILCAAFMAGQCVAQSVSGGMATQEPGPAQQVRNALRSAGATTCVDRIYSAASYLFAEGEGSFTLQPLGPEIDRWPIVLTIESHHEESGGIRLSILTIAPAASCSGTYEQIITWPQSCDEVKRGVYGEFTNETLLFRNIRQSELTPGIQVYLMASGTGCVSIKKELIR